MSAMLVDFIQCCLHKVAKSSRLREKIKSSTPRETEFACFVRACVDEDVIQCCLDKVAHTPSVGLRVKGVKSAHEIHQVGTLCFSHSHTLTEGSSFLLVEAPLSKKKTPPPFSRPLEMRTSPLEPSSCPKPQSAPSWDQPLFRESTGIKHFRWRGMLT